MIPLCDILFAGLLSCPPCPKYSTWSKMRHGTQMAATTPRNKLLKALNQLFVATVNEFCTPIFSSMGTTAMLIAVVIIIGILTQFLHNVVMAALFTPVLAPIFISMGGNPITFFFVLYAALCCSFGGLSCPPCPKYSTWSRMRHGTQMAATTPRNKLLKALKRRLPKKMEWKKAICW